MAAALPGPPPWHSPVAPGQRGPCLLPGARGRAAAGAEVNLVFSAGEHERLEATGFEVVGDTATAEGASVEIVAPGPDDATTITIALPGGGRLRLSIRLGRDN